MPCNRCESLADQVGELRRLLGVAREALDRIRTYDHPLASRDSILALAEIDRAQKSEERT